MKKNNKKVNKKNKKIEKEKKVKNVKSSSKNKKENIEDYTSKEKKKFKINKLKIAVAIIVLVILIVYTIIMVYNLIKNPTDTFIVSNGSLSEEETVIGYIVRDESLIENQKKNSSIIKIKEEGERVAKGNAVYRYYSSKETELEEKISQLNSKIQEALESNDNTFSSDKKLLESQIENELNNVYKVNEMQKIQEYKKSINTYITKKAKIVGDLSPSGSYIKNLMEERSEYENQLELESEYVTAQVSGLISYRVDGLENVLVPNDFGKLDKKFLEDLNLKAGQTVSSNSDSVKIINNYKCYLIFNSDSKQAKEVEVNNKIKIRIQNSAEITATIKNIIKEDDGSKTIAIEIDKQIEELIAYRKISFDIIWWSATGFRVPNSAIKEIDNVMYVVRNRNGYLNKMPVKVLKQNEEYSIVEQYTRSELLELGLTSEEISNFKTITLYDEILLNPTEEQIK